MFKKKPNVCAFPAIENSQNIAEPSRSSRCRRSSPATAAGPPTKLSQTSTSKSPSMRAPTPKTSQPPRQASQHCASRSCPRMRCRHASLPPQGQTSSRCPAPSTLEAMRAQAESSGYSGSSCLTRCTLLCIHCGTTRASSLCYTHPWSWSRKCKLAPT
jgi:hypothetical protein